MPLDHAKFPVVVGETADIATSVPCAENSKDAAGNTCLWSRTAASDGLAIWGTGELALTVLTHCNDEMVVKLHALMSWQSTRGLQHPSRYQLSSGSACHSPHTPPPVAWPCCFTEVAVADTQETFASVVAGEQQP